MDYVYTSGDEVALLTRLAPHFKPDSEPLDVQLAIYDDVVWNYLRVDLQLEGNRFLAIELDEDERGSVNPYSATSPFGAQHQRIARQDAEQSKLWKAVAGLAGVPDSMELAVRDFLLDGGGDRTPGNAEAVVKMYRSIANGDPDRLYIAFAPLRANTIARSRRMPVESDIRAELLTLAERVFASTILGGISLRHVGALVEPPRTGTRPADEIDRVNKVLDRIEIDNHDSSTIDWVAQYRVKIADTEAEKEVARRKHVEQYLGMSDADTVPLRSMVWAESAVQLATNYGIQDLHDKAVIRMQRLSRTDLGWQTTSKELRLPTAAFRQRARVAAKFSSWEQALAAFLTGDSPAGDVDKHKLRAAGFKLGIRDIVGGRSFGTHQLPERTRGSAEVENLARLVEGSLITAGMVLRVDLLAVQERFGTPAEDEIITFLTAIYGSTPELVKPFAQALRLFWDGQVSNSARLAIPLIETGARELLFLLDQPLYRMERAGSPGRFPAMDFYIEKLAEVGFDPDWSAALRGTLLSGGMNLRNRLAHGFQVEFTSEQAALLLRLAGLFVAMPIGTDAITDERVRTPLRTARTVPRRRIGWVWR